MNPTDHKPVYDLSAQSSPAIDQSTIENYITLEDKTALFRYKAMRDGEEKTFVVKFHFTGEFPREKFIDNLGKVVLAAELFHVGGERKLQVKTDQERKITVLGAKTQEKNKETLELKKIRYEQALQKIENNVLSDDEEEELDALLSQAESAELDPEELKNEAFRRSTRREKLPDNLDDIKDLLKTRIKQIDQTLSLLGVEKVAKHAEITPVSEGTPRSRAATVARAAVRAVVDGFRGVAHSFSNVFRKAASEIRGDDSDYDTESDDEDDSDTISSNLSERSVVSLDSDDEGSSEQASRSVSRAASEIMDDFVLVDRDDDQDEGSATPLSARVSQLTEDPEETGEESVFPDNPELQAIIKNPPSFRREPGKNQAFQLCIKLVQADKFDRDYLVAFTDERAATIESKFLEDLLEHYPFLDDALKQEAMSYLALETFPLTVQNKIKGFLSAYDDDAQKEEGLLAFMRRKIIAVRDPKVALKGARADAIIGPDQFKKLRGEFFENLLKFAKKEGIEIKGPTIPLDQAYNQDGDARDEIFEVISNREAELAEAPAEADVVDEADAVFEVEEEVETAKEEAVTKPNQDYRISLRKKIEKLRNKVRQSKQNRKINMYILQELKKLETALNQNENSIDDRATFVALSELAKINHFVAVQPKQQVFIARQYVLYMKTAATIAILNKEQGTQIEQMKEITWKGPFTVKKIEPILEMIKTKRKEIDQALEARRLA